VIDLNAMKAARDAATDVTEFAEGATRDQADEAPRPKVRKTRQSRLEAAGQMTLTLVPPGDKRAAGGAAVAPGRARYRALLADPAWPFKNKGTRLAPEYAGEQREEKQYETMAASAIVAMGGWVQSMMEDDALLGLWAPNLMVLEGTAVAVAAAWGFVPKQLVPWTKIAASTREPRSGGGNYTRVCSEQMLICTRGRVAPLIKDKGVAGALLEPGGLEGAFVAVRGNQHSKKPPEQYEMIERLIDGPYLELFGRAPRDGWDVMGDQAPIKATF
jgi:N6-adenosine-specific RNA methylase IME4